MAKERLIKLPETKGEFKIAGVVTGTKRGEKYFNNKKTRKGNDMNILSFGVETNKDQIIYTSLNGMVRDEVYFYKRPTEKGAKGTTKKKPWVDRYKFNEEGYKLIGINIGVSKKINNKGEQVNDNKMLTEYDACREVADNLEDGNSVFVKGNINYSSYKNDKGEVKRNVKFVPNQISLAKPIDFSEEDFKENNSFKQTIVFEDIEMDNENKDDVKGRVTAKIITYNTIETAEFIIKNKNLYNLFKKKLKPFSSITVWGHISNRIIAEEVSEEDVWGEENTFDKATKPSVKELIITGADPSSIDVETYSEEEIDKAIRALKEFGEETSVTNNSNNDDWGTPMESSDDEDDEW